MADDDNDKRKRPQGARPFAKRGDDRRGGQGKPFGGKKPFVKPRGEGAGPRPARSFDKPFRPRGEGKPFDKAGGAAAGPRPMRSFDTPFRPRGEGKPFDKAGGEGRGPRPGRRERADGPGGEGAAQSRPFRADFKPRDRDDRPRDGFKKDGGFRDKGGFKARGEFKPRDRSNDRPGERPKRPFDRKPGIAEFQRREAPAAEAAQAETGERIAKRLARAGIASRRDAEALIADGRVKVNGAVLTSPAFNVTAADRIELDGNEIPAIERTRLFLFNKPAGVVTTNRDPEGRRTVFDALPSDLPRLMTVGRLDINTEGLLLLTNDGGLARVLELPATGWLRRYRARVHGKVETEALASLKDGIAVDGVFYGGVEASLDREQGSNAWLTIGLREGKNREVKNILGSLGLEVTRLIRISYGPFQLGELAEGAVQELKGRMLRDQLGERLIEESGANFEAPIAKPFSNKPVAAERDDGRPARAERPRIQRDGIQGRIGEGGLIKQPRRRDRPDDREGALSRLTTTRPDRPFDKKSAGEKGKFGKFGSDKGKFGGGKASGPGKSFGPGKGKRDEPQEPVRARTTNVWMAPGARPQGKKAETSAKPDSRPRGGKDGGPRSGKPGSGPGRGGKGGADRRR